MPFKPKRRHALTAPCSLSGTTRTARGTKLTRVSSSRGDRRLLCSFGSAHDGFLLDNLNLTANEQLPSRITTSFRKEGTRGKSVKRVLGISLRKRLYTRILDTELRRRRANVRTHRERTKYVTRENARRRKGF